MTKISLSIAINDPFVEIFDLVFHSGKVWCFLQDISDFYVMETIRYSLWTFKMILIGPLTNSNTELLNQRELELCVFLNYLKSEEAVS